MKTIQDKITQAKDMTKLLVEVMEELLQLVIEKKDTTKDNANKLVCVYLEHDIEKCLDKLCTTHATLIFDNVDIIKGHYIHKKITTIKDVQMLEDTLNLLKDIK